MAYDVLRGELTPTDWSRGEGAPGRPSIAPKIVGGLVGAAVVVGLFAAGRRVSRARARRHPPTMIMTPHGSGYRINNKAGRAYFPER